MAETTVHAWFSAETALRLGSAVYRKPGGFTVNVTRMSAEREGKGRHPHDEKYVGEVIRREDGGCVSPTNDVNDTWMARRGGGGRNDQQS